MYLKTYIANRSHAMGFSLLRGFPSEACRFPVLKFTICNCPYMVNYMKPTFRNPLFFRNVFLSKFSKKRKRPPPRLEKLPFRVCNTFFTFPKQRKHPLLHFKTSFPMFRKACPLNVLKRVPCSMSEHVSPKFQKKK